MSASRHKSRILALQELYKQDVNSDRSVSLFNFLTDEEKQECGIETISYATFLVNLVNENLEDINAKILSYSRGRSLDRIQNVDLAILRLSFATILFDKEVHPSIVIDEAVKLSLEFSNDVNFKFVNGVLDSFVKSRSAK